MSFDMPIGIQINIHEEKNDQPFEERDDLFMIASFNRFPADITAENIHHRRYRLWLVRLVEDLNGRNVRSFDILDVLIRLQQHRKAGRLRNSSVVTKMKTEVPEDSIKYKDVKDGNSNSGNVIDGEVISRGGSQG